MKKFIYKNKTDEELVLIGFGVIEPHAEIESDVEINNANLELIEEKSIKAEKEEVAKNNNNKQIK